MTALRPCRHCHRRKTCPEKKAKQKAVRGVGLTMVDFRCPLPFADFRPGERVSATLDSYRFAETWSPHGCDPGMELVRDEVTVSGTVLRWKERERKVLVQFDREIGTVNSDKAIRIIAMWPDRLTKLDEAPRELCSCGFGQKADGGCDLPDGFVCYERPRTNDPEENYGAPPSVVAALKENERLLAEVAS